MRKPFWKSALLWSVGSFIGVALVRGLPFARGEWITWGIFVAVGLVVPSLVRLLDSKLRRFKSYREVEAKLGLKRDSVA